MSLEKTNYNKLSATSFCLTILGLFFLILTSYIYTSNNFYIYFGSTLLIVGFIVAIISLGGIRESIKTSLKVNTIGYIFVVMKSLSRLKDKNEKKGAGWAVASILIFLVVIIISLIAIIVS